MKNLSFYMRKILFILFTLYAFVGNAQYNIIGQKTQFYNGLSIPKKDTSYFKNIGDSNVVFIGLDSGFYYRVKGSAKKLLNTNDTAYVFHNYLKLSDSGIYVPYSILNNYTTRAAVNTSRDSVVYLLSVLQNSMATVATTGSYNDLSNKPTIPAAQVNADWNASTGIAQILNKPSLPSNVISGNYTPTTSSWSDLDSFHIKECQYIRVGSIVTVSGMIECYPTATGTITMGISLPVATNTNYNEKIAGTCASIEQPSTYPDAGSVSNEGFGSGRALISCTNTGGNSIKHIVFTFTYTIVP